MPCLERARGWGLGLPLLRLGARNVLPSEQHSGPPDFPFTVNSPAIPPLPPAQDEMLPASQMQALYDVHPSLPWRMVTFPDASHMDAFLADQDRYWAALFKFLYSDVFPGVPPLQRAPPAPALQKEDSGSASSHDWETVVPPPAELTPAEAGRDAEL